MKMTLEEENTKLKNILKSLLPEKSGQYFICGEIGEKDNANLPEYILVCPEYGADGFAVYKKDKDYASPGY